MTDATLDRIRPGLYRVSNYTCQCGGELRIEDTGNAGEFRWESFCTACKTCDPNGWPRLAEARGNLGYFREAAAHGTEDAYKVAVSV